MLHGTIICRTLVKFDISLFYFFLDLKRFIITKKRFSVTSICKIQGMRSIRQGRLGNALTWALKAHDGNFTTYIADQFLKHYAEYGELECRDLLENLGSCMLASDRLTFLGKELCVIINENE